MTQELTDVLADVEAGPVPEGRRIQFIDALAEIWGELEGSSEQATWRVKLYRAEELEWNPPVLQCQIERHGRTRPGVNGLAPGLGERLGPLWHLVCAKRLTLEDEAHYNEVSECGGLCQICFRLDMDSGIR